MFRGVKRETFALYTERRTSKMDDLQPQWGMKAQVSKTCLLLSFTDGDMKILIKAKPKCYPAMDLTGSLPSAKP